jgi:hypothetical protein
MKTVQVKSSQHSYVEVVMMLVTAISLVSTLDLRGHALTADLSSTSSQGSTKKSGPIYAPTSAPVRFYAETSPSLTVIT